MTRERTGKQSGRKATSVHLRFVSRRLAVGIKPNKDACPSHFNAGQIYLVELRRYVRCYVVVSCACVEHETD